MSDYSAMIENLNQCSPVDESFFASAAADFDNHFLATSWFVDHILRILIDKYARAVEKNVGLYCRTWLACQNGWQ